MTDAPQPWRDRAPTESSPLRVGAGLHPKRGRLLTGRRTLHHQSKTQGPAFLPLPSTAAGPGCDDGINAKGSVTKMKALCEGPGGEQRQNTAEEG